MINVRQLFIYPVKSLGGISVSSVQVTDRGFKHDRRYMLVDAENKFLSQRQLPAMALLQAEMHGDELSIHHKHTLEKLHFAFDSSQQELIPATIWSDVVPVQPVSHQADDWFSAQLGIKCRLVYMPDSSQRKVEETYAFNNELVSLADDFPALMISAASLNELNGRLGSPLNINRFRPNIVIDGCAPYAEDSFSEFSIGDMTAYGVKLCGRCPITTIDQNTGNRSAEPLATLATYRKLNNKVYFGQYLLFAGTGTIAVNDELTIRQTKPAPTFVR